jgi:glycosyltransferase involved in cell wall biosynthesis
MRSQNPLLKRNVLMLLSNPAIYDLRPLKEAYSLIKGGYNVTILSWDREGKYPRQDLSKGILIRRFKMKAPYGHHLKTIVSYFFFHLWCIFSSLGLKIDVIHCHDVDELFCGIFIKMLRLGRVKLVYDMHDHPLVFLEKFPKARFLVTVAFSMAKHYADHIIVVNESFVEYLLKIGFQRKKITVIMNVPPKSESCILNRRSKCNEGKFKIFYYGEISTSRGVHKLIEAAKDLENVELLLAGRGDLVPLIKALEKKYRNIKYLGWISISEINKLLKETDLIPSLYIPDNINHILASPAKLFTAFSYGIPALVPGGCYQSYIVKKYECGIVVDIDDIKSTKDAISELAVNRELYRKLGNNGFKAFNELFNWETMEKRLLKTYGLLVS